MKVSSQLLLCLVAASLLTQSFAIFCSQCISTRHNFSLDCQVGIRTVKPCPSKATSCVLKTITPRGPHSVKDDVIIRSCATPSRDLGCVTTPGHVTCTTICSRDSCNVGLPRRLQPSTTTESTTTESTTTESTTTESTTTTTQSTTTTETQQPTNRCYQCTSRNGRNPNCANSPSSSYLRACPADKPYCQVKITTSTFFARAHTVERSCGSNIDMNRCVSHGRGFINTCFKTCSGDGCNRGEEQGQSAPTAPTTTTTTITTESPVTSQRCYKCTSTNGQNSECETDPSSSYIYTCPDDKPFCTTKITTSSVYTSVRTVQRSCFETNTTHCVTVGGGLLNSCFTSCSGDLCNA